MILDQLANVSCMLILPLSNHWEVLWRGNHVTQFVYSFSFDKGHGRDGIL